MYRQIGKFYRHFSNLLKLPICLSPINISFVIVHKSLIDKSVTSRSRVITRKIPIAGARRYSPMHPFQTLKNYLNLGTSIFRFEHNRHMVGNISVRKRRIYAFHGIRYFVNRLLQLAKTVLVDVVNGRLHTTLFQQRDCCTKRDELAHSRHIDAIAVGITYLW